MTVPEAPVLTVHVRFDVSTPLGKVEIWRANLPLVPPAGSAINVGGEPFHIARVDWSVGYESGDWPCPRDHFDADRFLRRFGKQLGT